MCFCGPKRGHFIAKKKRETFQAEETTHMYGCLKVHDVFEELEDTKL